ncbi:chemotaxis protein CheW [Pseudobacteroides cellulosolvens]|uniref:CheW protein n=1 Tax=Pseudobacteroides cellulosolvens ATCC 35603 = DSM 2933 TaxID=398512 RepID=A0A0L6JUJ2_9FIRM|nr:chemotaxis protein CheW [Pseudobacteroides cellulosolvens]KNY29315.1 CheW protein [Pseudobacteroides cellulosolvens ATCC 35603 = DSM 2933]
MAQVLEEVLGVSENTQKDKYLTFALGKEEYGIEIRYVTEIIGLQAITEVPEFSGYLKGIVNLRGKIIPVIDVRLRFNKETKEYNDRTCTIVIEVNGICVGLIVDNVAEVLSITEENIVPPPNISNEQNKYIKGIGKVDSNVKLILDCEKLLSDFEMPGLNSIE